MKGIRKHLLVGMPVIVALASANATFPQTPLGGEFRINQKTELNQGDQHLAVSKDGSFVVVWSDLWDFGGEGLSSFVASRFYDMQGQPVGDELYPAGPPGATDQGGFAFAVSRPVSGFRLVWSELHMEGFPNLHYDLRLRNYSAAGAPLGGIFIRPYFDERMLITDFEVAPSGRMALAWFATQSEVKLASINARGELLGQEVILASEPEGSFVSGLGLGLDAGGHAVAAWAGDCDRAGCRIFAQRFSRPWQRIGKPIAVGPSRKTHRDGPRVAVAPDGSFLVAWVLREPQFPDNPFAIDVAAQFFLPSGEKVGPELRLGHVPNNDEGHPEVAADPEGNFVAVWSSFRRENGVYGFDIWGQLFRKNGRRFGKPFRINTHQTANEFTHPKVAFGGNGTFVVIWEANDGSFDGVFGQRFASPFGN